MPTDKFWEDLLGRVETLLLPAARGGYRLEAEQAATLMLAREEQQKDMLSPVIGARLLDLYGVLSQAMQPPTVKALKRYRNIVIVLMAVIVPFSVATFVSLALRDLLHQDLNTANSLSLNLQKELAAGDTPVAGVAQSDVDQQRQQLATTLRVIRNRAGMAQSLTLFLARDPRSGAAKGDVFALIEDPSVKNQDAAAKGKEMLGNVAPLTENLIATIQMVYGAINTCVLPILYAWLGACAFVLRRYSQGVGDEQVMRSAINTGRLVIAGIGGMVIGFFNNLIAESGASFSPFAEAFLVGYAVEVFYDLIEAAMSALANTVSSHLGVKPGATLG